MKKLLTAAGIALVCMAACTNNSTTATTTDSTGTQAKEATEVQTREKEISDSTKMLDKKLKDPNSKYSPDSLK